LKQITTLLHNKKYNDNTAKTTEMLESNTNMDPAASLRVPETDPTITNTMDNTTENPTLTYQTVNQPKR